MSALQSWQTADPYDSVRRKPHCGHGEIISDRQTGHCSGGSAEQPVLLSCSGMANSHPGSLPIAYIVGFLSNFKNRKPLRFYSTQRGVSEFQASWGYWDSGQQSQLWPQTAQRASPGPIIRMINKEVTSKQMITPYSRNDRLTFATATRLGGMRSSNPTIYWGTPLDSHQVCFCPQGVDG